MATPKKPETILTDLKEISEQKKKLEAQESELRSALFDYMKKQGIANLKNDFASASIVTRKKLEMDEVTVIDELKKKKLSHYYETKTSLTKDFEKAVKEGIIELESVTITTSESTMVKFT